MIAWTKMTAMPRADDQSEIPFKFVFTSDNQMVITSSADGVAFYGLAGGQMLRRLDVVAQDIAMGPAGRLLAVLHDGRVALWGVQEQ
jgi:hypothetical protein